MKKATTIVFLLWGLVSTETGCSSSKPPANQSHHFDLGKVLPGKSTKATVRITNQEKFTLRLVRAEVTCGCLTPEIETAEIQPGDDAVITLTLAHSAKEGVFEQRASFFFTGDNNQEIAHTLFLTGTVIPWVTATPALVDFGRHMLGERCVAQTQLQFPEPVDTTGLEIECSNPFLSVRLHAGKTDTEKILELTYYLGT